jgi:hypothetical protein
MSDKPAHVLEIPDSLGRDIDKGLQPPVEAFLSDDALQAQWDATRASSEPVHAENLIPISRQSASSFTQSALDGQALPKVSTRRVIPAPFRRDRVTGASHHGKEWETVRASGVRAGDIITGIGLVVNAEQRLVFTDIKAFGDEAVVRKWGGGVVATGTEHVITGAGGVEQVFAANASVRVFRKPVT